MKKISLVTALIATVALAPTLPAGAGISVGPSAFKILKGALGSEAPLPELQTNDDDYFIVIYQESGSDAVASYQLTYTEIPDLEEPTDFRINLAAKGSPTCSVRMWHWRRERFIQIGDPISVADKEVETFIELANPNRFVRRDKARAKITCADAESFAVGTDIAAINP